MEAPPESVVLALLSLGWSGCGWDSLIVAMPEMHSQSSTSAVGSQECAQAGHGGCERMSKNPKNGVEGKGGRTQYLARKRKVGFFPSLHLLIFSQCNALQSSSCCSLPVSPLFASGAVASLLSTSSPQLGRSLWGRQQGPQGFCWQRSSPQALPASSWQLCAHGSVQ